MQILAAKWLPFCLGLNVLNMPNKLRHFVYEYVSNEHRSVRIDTQYYLGIYVPLQYQLQGKTPVAYDFVSVMICC